MSLPLPQQAIQLISRAKHILITTREHPTLDAIASTVALGLLLKKLKKDFDILIPGTQNQLIPNFLPKTTGIQSTIGAIRSFRLQVNVSQTPLSELMYDVKDGKLDITLVPKHGEWSPSDITFRAGEDRYDLIITLDAPDRTSLGSLNTEHADLLHRLPVINIDHHASNEQWGAINLVDITCSSTCEVLCLWLAEWNPAFFDADLATAILAGMIANTHSFRKKEVSPKTLSTAAYLVEIGARRDAIIQGIWRTRSINTLKLWGRMLSRLETIPDSSMIVGRIYQTDFAETQTTENELNGIVDDILSYAPNVKIILFCIEQEAQKTKIIVHNIGSHSAQELVRPFSGSGTAEYAQAFLNGSSFIETTNRAIETIKKLLS